MQDFDSIFHSHHVIYLHGKTKSGKTTSILNYVKDNQKEYRYMKIQELKNDQDFMNLLNTKNIYNMFLNKQQKYKYIIIDNLDYIHTNDKKILSFLIKFFKKKQHNEFPMIYFIFIGTNTQDKKIIELMQYTYTIEYIPEQYVDYDKATKDIVCSFLNHEQLDISKFGDKNIIALIYHENSVITINNNYKLYEIFLRNFCNGDYYDRISFKKQLWQFNEMTFYIKVVYNSYLLKHQLCTKTTSESIIFTKILTKFSIEYSNQNFIIRICNLLKCTKEELYDIIQKNNTSYLNHLTLAEQKRIMRLM